MLFKRSAALAVGLISFLSAQAFAAPSLPSLVSPVKDYSTTVTATQVNTQELVKISKDYANSYKVKTSRVYYKNPGLVKVDGSVGPIPIVYVIKGDKKFVKYGPIKREINVVDKPGQKQGLVDFGLLTADQLDDYTWKYLKADGPYHVYELRFKNIKEDPSRRIIWVDPKHKVVVRKQTYHQFRDNDLKFELRFSDIKAVAPGVYAPTTIKVYNDQGKLGAVSKKSKIKVNSGISAGIFKV